MGEELHSWSSAFVCLYPDGYLTWAGAVFLQHCRIPAGKISVCLGIVVMMYQPQFAGTRIRLVSTELACPTKKQCSEFFFSTSDKLHGVMDAQFCPAEKTSVPWKTSRSSVSYCKALMSLLVEKGTYPMFTSANWCIDNPVLFCVSHLIKYG